MLKYKKLDPAAGKLTYGSKGAIGLDLEAVVRHEDGGLGTLWLHPGERMLVKTGIAVSIPDGYYGRIAPRSGLALKQGLDVLAGVIDSDYRGEIGVLLINLGENGICVATGDRIAQLIIEKAERFLPTEVKDLDASTRGESGFGSTGV